jgi:hypothetical protein
MKPRVPVVRFAAAMSKRYRIMFHFGNLIVRRQDIQQAELFRLHGLGRVIRIEGRAGTVFVSVIRLMIGQFAFINFLRTVELHKALIGCANQYEK